MKKYKFFISLIITVLIAGVLVLGGCGKSQEVNPTYTELGIRGYITKINSENGNVSILVEGQIEKDTQFDKALARITKDTMIQKDDLSRLFEARDLKVGDKVEVYFTGAIAESYPIQGTASIVRIITK
jgi:hypothetical protein